MSINDILADENFFLYMGIFFIVTMIFAIPAGLSRSKKTQNDIYGDDYTDTADIITTHAKVASRRGGPHPLTPTVTINYVVFEFDDGKRVELAIKDTTVYSIMIEGDAGTLKYAGKKFISFERNATPVNQTFNENERNSTL